MAGRQGVEPRLNGSEPFVLPLNDLPTKPAIYPAPRIVSRTGPSGRPRGQSPVPLVECAPVRTIGHCALEELLGVVGDRWSLQVVMALLRGPMRTTELVAALAPVSTRTLADRLKRLEAAGVLTRHAYAEAPPRVEYALTSRGRCLEPALLALRQAALAWGDVECDGHPCNSCDGVPHSRATAHHDGEQSRNVSTPVDVTLL